MTLAPSVEVHLNLRNMKINLETIGPRRCMPVRRRENSCALDPLVGPLSDTSGRFFCSPPTATDLCSPCPASILPYPTLPRVLLVTVFRRRRPLPRRRGRGWRVWRNNQVGGLAGAADRDDGGERGGDGEAAAGDQGEAGKSGRKRFT